jgi:hypothetical protein
MQESATGSIYSLQIKILVDVNSATWINIKIMHDSVQLDSKGTCMP